MDEASLRSCLPATCVTLWLSEHIIKLVTTSDKSFQLSLFNNILVNKRRRKSKYARKDIHYGIITLYIFRNIISA